MPAILPFLLCSLLVMLLNPAYGDTGSTGTAGSTDNNGIVVDINPITPIMPTLVGNQCALGGLATPTAGCDANATVSAITATSATTPCSVGSGCYDGAASTPGTALIPIDLFGHCRFVDNSSATTSLFVPFRTDNEWTAFYNNSPGVLTLAHCSKPQNGLQVTASTACPNPSPTAATVNEPNYQRCTPATDGSGGCIAPYAPTWTAPDQTFTCNPGGLGAPWSETVTATFTGLDSDSGSSWNKTPATVTYVADAAACGSANGTTPANAPTTGLCASGSFAGNLNGNGPWSWSCTTSQYAVNNTVMANCATNAPILCPAGTQSWSVAGVTCSGPVAERPSGSTATASSTAANTTGSASFTCNAGTFEPATNATCSSTVAAACTAGQQTSAEIQQWIGGATTCTLTVNNATVVTGTSAPWVCTQGSNGRRVYNLNGSGNTVSPSGGGSIYNVNGNNNNFMFNGSGSSVVNFNGTLNNADFNGGGGSNVANFSGGTNSTSFVGGGGCNSANFTAGSLQVDGTTGGVNGVVSQTGTYIIPACGTANSSQAQSAPTSNLCAYGTPSAVTQNGTHWSWSCDAGAPMPGSVSCQTADWSKQAQFTYSCPASMAVNQTYVSLPFAGAATSYTSSYGSYLYNPVSSVSGQTLTVSNASILGADGGSTYVQGDSNVIDAPNSAVYVTGSHNIIYGGAVIVVNGSDNAVFGTAFSMVWGNGNTVFSQWQGNGKNVSGIYNSGNNNTLLTCGAGGSGFIVSSGNNNYGLLRGATWLAADGSHNNWQNYFGQSMINGNSNSLSNGSPGSYSARAGDFVSVTGDDNSVASYSSDGSVSVSGGGETIYNASILWNATNITGNPNTLGWSANILSGAGTLNGSPYSIGYSNGISPAGCGPYAGGQAILTLKQITTAYAATYRDTTPIAITKPQTNAGLCDAPYSLAAAVQGSEPGPWTWSCLGYYNNLLPCSVPAE